MSNADYDEVRRAEVGTDQTGSESVDRDGSYPRAVDCVGCDRAIATFSGVRSYCIRCTRDIMEFDIVRREFASGQLDASIDRQAQKTLEDFSS